MCANRLGPYDLLELKVLVLELLVGSGLRRVVDAAAAAATRVVVRVLVGVESFAPRLVRAGRSVAVVEQTRLEARMALQVGLGAIVAHGQQRLARLRHIARDRGRTLLHLVAKSLASLLFSSPPTHSLSLSLLLCY